MWHFCVRGMENNICPYKAENKETEEIVHMANMFVI